MIYALVALLLASCTPGPGAMVTTPDPAREPPGMAEARALVAAAARAYKVVPPALMVGDHVGDATAGAMYRRGVIAFTTAALVGPSRDALVAHELGHYVLGHEHPSMRTQEEREHQANIEAVRILQAGRGLSEEEALRVVLQWLGRLSRSGSVARGHASPCQEIRAVVVAYPAQRGWSAAMECTSGR